MEPQNIQSILPQALQTLGPTTKASSDNTDKARRWLLGSGWTLVGNETPEEKTILAQTFGAAVDWLAAWLDGLAPYWLVLAGLSGVGKTLLVKRICEYIHNWGRQVYGRTEMAGRGFTTPEGASVGFVWSEVQHIHPFQTWASLVPHCDANRTRLACALKSWTLACDDIKPQTGQLGVNGDGEEAMEAIKPKPFESTAAGDLMNERGRKWSIFTTNLSRTQLAVFWDIRIASRLTRDGNVLVDLSAVRDFNLRREALKK